MKIVSFFKSAQLRSQTTLRSDAIWPEPEPLRNTLLPVNPLPISHIPAPYRDWVIDVSERMQCPPDFIAVAAMVTTASLIGY